MKNKGNPQACPICSGPVPPRKENPAFPFCGARCQRVDLGRWLGEEYTIAEPGHPVYRPDDDKLH